MNRRELLPMVGLLSMAEPLASTAAAAALPGSSSLSALRAAAGKRWAASGFATHRVAAGGTTHYVALAGKGPPVVLLHGYPQSGEIWRHIAPVVARDHQVIVADLPGMGLSDAGQSPHTVLAAAEAIDALLQTLGIARAAVVGHDWGGAVSATLALAHRDRVSRLVFIESALAGAGFLSVWRFDRPNPKLTFIPFLLMQGTSEALVAGREETFLHHLWETFTGDKAAAPFADWAPYVAALRIPGRFTAAADYYRSAYASAEDTRRLLAAGKLAIPVLPIAGAQSLGSANEAMARNFAADVRPGLVLPGVGHFAAEERAAEVSAALRAFLEE
jgi:pimeloyl-ACP methyl ester carboxylesterase